MENQTVVSSGNVWLPAKLKIIVGALALAVSTVACSGKNDQSGVVSDSSTESGSLAVSQSEGDTNGSKTGSDTNVGVVKSADKTKCTFFLRGKSGAEWFVERYTDVYSSCLENQEIVKANNPNAVIFSNSSNYVHDSVVGADKFKCAFILRGSTGSKWLVERYAASSADCQGAETSVVRMNNPLATIYSLTVNYVHDLPNTADKTKCTYSLQGQTGAKWFVERYLPAGSACNTTELDVVRSNNPNATVLQITANYVYDPFL